MDTIEEQKAFFAAQADGLREAAAEGPDALVAFVRARDDATERRVLWALGRQVLSKLVKRTQDLDLFVALADAGLEEVMGEAEATEDRAIRKRRRHTAHMIAYNLAADLAPCWPGDDVPRDERHLARGRDAAATCLKLVAAQGNDPQRLGTDLWARGVHEAALGRYEDAVLTFTASRDAAALASDGETEPGPEAPFGVNLAHGFLALAQAGAGEDAAARKTWDEAIGAFRAAIEAGEDADDARFGMLQLEAFRLRHDIGLPSAE